MLEATSTKAKSKFSITTLALSMLVAGTIELVCQTSIVRAPSSTDPVELTITSLNIPSGSIFKGGDNLYLRASIKGQKPIEWGKGEKWAVAPGEKLSLDIRNQVENSWVQNDELEFKLEVVKKGMLTENVMVRCAQIAKQVSFYNRNYTCTVPGDASPLLTYRVGRRVDPSLPAVAQANAQ